MAKKVMSETTVRKDSKSLYGDWYTRLTEFGEGLLREHTVLSVAEYHQRLSNEFEDDYDDWAIEKERNLMLTGKDRKRFDNLVDWSKARMTMQRKTCYLTLNRVKYIVWCPPIGHVTGQGALLTMSHMIKILYAIKENMRVIT